MTVRSMIKLPAAVLMTTALAWGVTANAAGLGVGVGARADASLGANAVGTDVRMGAHGGISGETRTRALSGITGGNQARINNQGKSGGALTAITDARAQTDASVGSEVKEAVSVDGQIRSGTRATIN